ncbi:MAG: hypothetical protein EP330_22040 [Deltaproteobacteria bacterium]|nr:MAG: hypothetical protein EP330_22040 [Deltaproteobacteria bacterium]
MGILTVSTVAKAGLELFLGVCIKLLIDNGRIHPADFVNDFLFWVPGLNPQDGTGIERQVQAMIPESKAPEAKPQSKPIAA